MLVLMTVRSTMRVAVCAGSMLMSLMLAIVVMLITAFVFVFGFVCHFCSLAFLVCPAPSYRRNGGSFKA
jgi:tetrahydromethanopterin S-methyltransferase subunit D